MRHAWEWGRRYGLEIAIGGALGTITVLLAVLVIVWVGAAEQPLEFRSPQTITNVGPISASAGTPVEVAAFKCNTADHNVSFHFTRQWRRIDVRPTVLFVDEGDGVYAPHQGCDAPSLFANEHPPGVVPGVWQIEGVQTITSGGQQVAPWVTEPFTVVP